MKGCHHGDPRYMKSEEVAEVEGEQGGRFRDGETQGDKEGRRESSVRVCVSRREGGDKSR